MSNVIQIRDKDGKALYPITDASLIIGLDSSPSKMAYQRTTYFQVGVDCVQMNASSFSAFNPNICVEQNILQDNAVLLLPESYTQKGTPTRLVIFCKQGNNQITDSTNPILTDNAMGNIFHFLLAMGYAILGADGVPDGLSSSLGLDDTRVSGNYVAVQSTRKAYDYVIKNYNIYDDGAFIFGYSQGGMYAQNVVDLSGIPFLGCAMVSPALSMHYHLWDLASTKTIGGVSWSRTSRLNISRLYGYPTVTTDAQLLALAFDKEKVAGYDPWNRNVENPYESFTQSSSYGSNLWALPSGTSIDSITMKKRLGCPTKIWVAENDATLGADVTKVFVKACRNAGQVCDLCLYNSGNHHIFQSTYQSPAISTFDDNGTTYDLYPIAYEIAAFFDRLGGMPLTDISITPVSYNYVDMTLTQGGIMLVPSAQTVGGQCDSATSNYAKRINFSNAFYWESGQKLKIKGLKGLNSTSGSLKIDGGIYSSQTWGHSSYVNTMNGGTTSYYTINSGGTEDEIEITNTWGNYWFVLSFSAQDGTDEISASDFSPMQILVY